MATTQGNLDLMTFLIDAGANVNAPNKDGLTPLIVGCYHGNSDVVNLLLQRGANPTHYDKVDLLLIQM